jgi:serine/threonine protein kinase
MCSHGIWMAKRFGKYWLHECVAQGGITEIWLATDQFDNVMAVRLLKPASRGSSAPKLFKAGLKVHQKLSPHPNVIRYIDHGKAGGVPFMVLEYIQGSDLKMLFSRHHDHIENVADVLIQMTDGLNHLHDQGWMHLDYKPENVMVSLNGHVSLLDFDTVQKLPRKPKKFPKITGTPAYMPPEHLRGKAIDHRADIYAWGITAYELLTHRKPFVGRNPEEALRNQLKEKHHVKPVHQFNPDVPVALSALIQKCFAFHPEERFPSLTILNAQLHKILGVRNVPLVPTSLGELMEQPSFAS